ncbi:MAG TPA: hypothetical protein VFD04_04080 [Actinomycetes bacterium]|jgi:hypothetical protein|nr:hypothetical protein [Actinomycetes bacterium]
MTERYGYGYGDEPSGQRPAPGQGPVSEREPADQAGEREEHVIDLTDGGDPGEDDHDAHDERMREVHDEEEPPSPPVEEAATPPAPPQEERPGSSSIFEVEEPAPAETPEVVEVLEVAETPEAAEVIAEEEELAVVEAPAPAAAEPAAPAAAAPPATLLATIDADDVRRRFLDIQASFVDEPRQAVEEAGRFAEDLVQQVIAALQEQQGRLGTPVAGGDTEELRQALRDFRRFVDRLLALAL